MLVLVVLSGLWILDTSTGILLSEKESFSPPPSLSKPLLVSDLEETGWTLVFRTTAGNKENVYESWTRGHGTTVRKPFDMQRSYDSHYRDPMVDHWELLNPSFVKLALYMQSMEVAYVVFDGQGSDQMDWFSRSRLVASSWSDLIAQNTYNFFSIEGGHPDDDDYFRSFHINNEYEGCDGDIGHLAVLEHDAGCDWDHQTSYPQFIYSDMNGADRWNRLTYGRADYMAVHVFISS